MSRATLRLWTLLTLVSLILFAGCFGAYQSTPDNPQTVGGLTPSQEDKDAGRVGVAAGFNVSDYRVLGIERFHVAKSQIEDEGDQRFADRMVVYYQAKLVRRLGETGLFSQVVSLNDNNRPTGTEKTLMLRGTITRLGRGSQALRYFVGFGAGSTRAQAELHFVDAATGRIVLVTADRRLGSAGFFGGDDKEFLEESFDDMARDLARFLVRLSKGEAPR